MKVANSLGHLADLDVSATPEDVSQTAHPPPGTTSSTLPFY
jgi:hypothetical protein